MMQRLKPLLDNGTIDRNLLDQMYKTGMLKIPNEKSRRFLRSHLPGKPKGGFLGFFNPYKAHHDLPLEFVEKFIRAGLDPNDPSHGRWIPDALHKLWHQGGGGGKFNEAWIEFFADSPEATSVEILAELDRLRKNVFSYTPPQ